MFSFLTFRGEFVVTQSGKPAEASEIFRRLESALERKRPSFVERRDEELFFEAGLFRFVAGWNILGPIGSGRIAVARADGGVRVQYEINFHELFFYTTTFIVIGFGTIAVVARGPASEKLSMLLAAWLWLFGGNVILTLFRFPRFLRRAAQS